MFDCWLELHADFWYFFDSYVRLCTDLSYLFDRHLAGQKEYEVELEFSSSITGFPSRVNPGEEYRDGEEPIPGSLSSMGSDPRYVTQGM